MVPVIEHHQGGWNGFRLSVLVQKMLRISPSFRGGSWALLQVTILSRIRSMRVTCICWPPDIAIPCVAAVVVVLPSGSSVSSHPPVVVSRCSCCCSTSIIFVLVVVVVVVGRGLLLLYRSRPATTTTLKGQAGDYYYYFRGAGCGVLLLL